MANAFKNLANVATFRGAVQAMINRSCLLSYGIVKDIPSAGVVTVELSVARSKRGVRIITCPLVNIASNTITLDVVVEKGDKVLVLFLDRFDSEMFDTDKTSTIFNEHATGYSLFSGVAIPINQYRKNEHRNFVQCKEGGVTVNLFYDEGEKKNKVVLDVTSDGILTYTVGGNKATLDLLNTGSALIGMKYNEGEDKNDVTLTLDAETGKIDFLVLEDELKADLADSKQVYLKIGDSTLTIDMSSSGDTTVTDNNGNTMVLTADGLMAEDCNGNKVETTSSGVAMEDKNGNKIEGTSSGMTITDKNGCKIEMTSSATKINGKLEIKK